MYGLSYVSYPASEPVDLDTAKNHLRVATTADDALITAFITAAREQCEEYTKRRFITQQLMLTLPNWTGEGEGEVFSGYFWYAFRYGGGYGLRSPIYIPVEPVQSIDSLQYYDTTGTLQTLPAGPPATPGAACFQTWLAHSPPLVAPWPLTNWPILNVEQMAAVQVTFTAGYGDGNGDPGNVPASVTAAMLLMLTYWYENRGDGADPTMLNGLPFDMGMPPGAKRILRMLHTGGYP